MAPADPGPPPPKKRMHGALTFFLMALAGAFASMICTPCVGGAAISASKGMALMDQYQYAIVFFIGSSVLSLVLSGILMLLKRWGTAGFFFGVSMLMALAIVAALFMRMFDTPHYWR